ncbi:MAG: futalosine hydrolase [Bacteroidota bacterium]
MNILLITATPFELAPLQEQLKQQEQTWSNLSIQTLVTGVGLPLTAWSLGQHLATNTYDYLIQAGVGGAIDCELALGDVVEVRSECFADLGVEEADGRFTSAIDLGLVDADELPFQGGRLWNQPEVERHFLPQVHGISVNKVHGYEPSIERLRENYPFAQVESMEGAAFFYAALQAQTPFLQLRSISNYVEKRQRDKWELGLAIERLNGVLYDLLATLAEAEG